MSLFGSIYEEARDADAPEPIDVPDVPLDPTAGLPAPPPVPAPSMSLQDFAAEVFGTRSEPAATSTVDVPPGAFAAAVDGMAPPDPPETGDGGADTDMSSPLVPAPEPFETAVATLPPPQPEPPGPTLEPQAEAGTDLLPPGNDGGTTGAPLGLDPFTLINDDLLPVQRPRRGPSVAGISVGGAGRHAKLALILVVALVSGFVGYRTLGGGEGGAGGGADQVDDANALLDDVAGGEVPGLRDLGGALDATQLVAAEADLRALGLQAMAHFAETGSFNLPPERWAELLGRTVVAGGGAPQEGAIQVVADDDAVCFETATQGGTTVATGITADTVGFASDGSGASICTADAAVLASWQASLILSGS